MIVQSKQLMILDWCFIQLVTSRENKPTITSKNTKRKTCLEPVLKFTYNSEEKKKKIKCLRVWITVKLLTLGIHMYTSLNMLSDESMSQLRDVKFTSQANVSFCHQTFFI